MRITLTLYLTLFLLSACSITSELPNGVEGQIPENANRVDVYSDQPVDRMFTELQQWLPGNGFPIKDTNEVTRRIDTEGADIGQRTTMRITLRVIPHTNGSKMEAIGSWSTDVEETQYDASSAAGVSAEQVDWYPAIWQGGSNRSSFAYAQLVTLFHEMPAMDRVYVKQ